MRPFLAVHTSVELLSCLASSFLLHTPWLPVNHCSRAPVNAIAMYSSLVAPPDGDSNRATELNALAWIWFAVSSAVVGLRFYSRLALTRNLWWDDWFILITLVRHLPILGSFLLTMSQLDTNINLHFNVDLHELPGWL